MRHIDLDKEFVDLICFVIAAGLVLFAQFKPETSDKVYDFASLSAGAALRGLGTERKNNDYEDGDRR